MIIRLIAVAALASAALPAAANAQTYNNYNAPVQTGTFGNNGGIGNTTFTNSFTFLVTRAGTLATDFTNTSQGNPLVMDGGSSDIDFSGASLSGGTLGSALAYTKLIGEPLVRTETWSVINPVYLGAGTYTLTVNGRSYGSTATYSGNFSVSAVPELATWAMMILGVGLIGGMQRRRRSVDSKLQFA